MKILILLLFTSTTIFADNDLNKYTDEKEKATMKLANQYYALNNNTKVLTILRAYLREIPNFYDANIYTAYIYQNKNELSKSLKHINNAIDIDSTKAEAFYYRGYYYLKTGDTLSALQDFSKTIILNPNFHHGYHIFSQLINNAALNSTFKRNTESKFKKSMEIKGYSYYNGHYNLGLFFLKTGNYNKALSNFEKSVIHKKYEAQSYYSMGLAYYYNRNYAEALKVFSLAAGLKYKTNETQRYLTHISRLNKIKQRK